MIKNSNEIKLYQETGAGLLINENKKIFDNLWLIGLDTKKRKSTVKDAQRGIPLNTFKIGLFHYPEFFEKNYKDFDLVLAGHSHGGQIRIPFLSDLVLDLKKNVGGFVEGWFQKENSKMYVSRGVGTSTLPIRFLCRPEVAIIELEPSSN
jgi:predicted MPP superfamily phosphohydrolase